MGRAGEDEEVDEAEDEEAGEESEAAGAPPPRLPAGDIELTSVRVQGGASATSRPAEEDERDEETHGLLSSTPRPLSPVASAYPSARASAAPRLPYRYFFAAPPFEKRTFVRHLLCHLAAVVAWTGMWDLTDSIIRPAPSESC